MPNIGVRMVGIIGLSAMVALVLTFFAGRWSAPEHVKVVTQTVTVDKKTDDETKHEKVTKVEVKQPNGTDTTTTTIVDDSEDKSTDDSTVSQTTTKESSKSSSKLTISALAGVNITSPGSLIYGASISRPILGPVTVGLFGLSNGVGGASVGLTF